MKTTLRLFIIALFVLTIGITGNAQTNVGGHITTNTTWTLANSPYILSA